MSKQMKFPTIQANLAKDPQYQVPEHLAKDHYLLLLEKEKWEKGQKVSKSYTKLVPITDFISYQEDRFFEKHDYAVEILHDPTREEGFEDDEDDEDKGEGKGKQVKLESSKKKADYVQELADLLEVDAKDIDPSLTVTKLKEYIASETAKKDKGEGKE